MKQIGQEPIATAETFAKATRKQFEEQKEENPTLEKVQALLLLGHHEVTCLSRNRACEAIGAAIVAIGLLRYRIIDQKRVPAADGDDDYAHAEQNILREIKRRTFWSCFIMDRSLSCGEARPPMLSVDRLHVQLPCSDDAFSHGRDVRTRLLGEGYDAYDRRRRDEEDGSTEWEFGKDEGELCVYIDAMAHFAKVMEWTNDTGRRSVFHSRVSSAD